LVIKKKPKFKFVLSPQKYLGNERMRLINCSVLWGGKYGIYESCKPWVKS